MNYKDLLGLSGAFFVLGTMVIVFALFLFFKFEVPYIIRVLRNMLVIGFAFLIVFSVNSYAAGIQISESISTNNSETKDYNDNSDINKPVIGKLEFECSDGGTVTELSKSAYITNSKGKIKVFMPVSDDESGEDFNRCEIYINKIKQKFQKYNDNITFEIKADLTKNKYTLNKLECIIVDNKKNLIKCSYDIYIDSNAPEINTSFRGNVFSKGNGIYYYSKKRYLKDLSMNLEVVDDYFLKELIIIKEGKVFKKFSGSEAFGKKLINLSFAKEKEKIEIIAVDKANNTKREELIFINDESAPVFSMEDETIQIVDSSGIVERNSDFNTYFTSNEYVTIRICGIIDEKAGIKEVRLFCDSDGEYVGIPCKYKEDAYEANIVLPVNLRVKMICMAKDELGQISYYKGNYSSILRGESSPEIKTEFVSKNIIQNEDETVFNKSCVLKIDVVDEIGIKDFYVTINDKEIIAKSNMLNDLGHRKELIKKESEEIDIAKYIEKDDIGILKIFVCDYFGNEKYSSDFKFIKDDKGPVIEEIYINKKKVVDYQEYHNCIDAASIRIVAEDGNNLNTNVDSIAEVKYHLLDIKNREMYVKPAVFNNGGYEFSISAPFNGTVVIELVDIFGNTTFGNGIKLIVEKEKVFIKEPEIEKTKPEIDVIFSDGKYEGLFNTKREATIRITDKNFNKKNVIIDIKNSYNRKAKSSDFQKISKDVYESEIEFNDDGDYELYVGYLDTDNNEESYGPIRFSIDKNAPIIEVKFDKNPNNGYINEKCTATVKVLEKSFDSSFIKINKKDESDDLPEISEFKSMGENHYATLVFDKSGEYSFVITGFDKAKNQSSDVKIDKFILDLTNPEVLIDGVKDGMAYNENIGIRINVNDENLEKDEIKISILKNNDSFKLNCKRKDSDNSVSITYDDFPHNKNFDGVYNLNIFAKDKAGNVSTENISFSINRFGSSFYVNNDYAFKNHMYQKNASDIEICEVNTDELLLGNCFVKLLKNGYLVELEEGKDYTITKENKNFKNTYLYRIYKELFSEDGVYVLSVYSKDAAGNVNSLNSGNSLCEVSFGVDNTPPLAYMISPKTIDENSPGKTAYVFIKDNLSLENVEVRAGNKLLDFVWEGELVKFKLPGKGDGNLKIKARDSAGNTTFFF